MRGLLYSECVNAEEIPVGCILLLKIFLNVHTVEALVA